MDAVEGRRNINDAYLGERDNSMESVNDDDGHHKNNADDSKTDLIAEATVGDQVLVDELAGYVAGKSMDDLVEEFESIPRGLTKPFADSQRPENIGRNRYKGLYPYDANRVKLHTGISEYINASYINGVGKDREYIAALGPTDTTTSHFATFWTMIWQEMVDKIVILTNVKNLSEQYWPDLDSCEEYGDVKVINISEKQFTECTVRTFCVTKDSERRTVYHFHYTAWPDMSVPDGFTGLMEFRNKVFTTESCLNGPIVVHCSAGVGRTGTYIAIDYLTKEGEETGSIDVFSCFADLRAQRVSMIETEEQYQYLHDAVVYNFTFGKQINLQ